MPKKIAIVACYFHPNYGSQLQSLATQKILDDLGIENEIINITGLKKQINSAKYKYFFSRIIDPNTVKDKIGTLTYAIQLKINKNSFGRNVAIRNSMFSKFADEMFKLSKVYASKEDLGNNCHKYAAVLIGSDQLWLPSNIEADYYTLNFVPEDIPKIAFATSFGVSTIPKAQRKKAATFLKRIDFLSTREKSGQQIIKELTDRDVPVVCDPTLLFTSDDWLYIQKIKRIITEKYIFCYLLGNNPIHRRFVQELKKITGYKIVQLKHLDEYIKSDEFFSDYSPYDIGPSEYISLIRDSEYVCTDSFHGTVFSILHSKPFFSFRRYQEDSSVSTNSRLHSIMSSLNLKDRSITGEESLDDCINREIDYDTVNKLLAEFRDSSKEYLINALNHSGIKV